MRHLTEWAIEFFSDETTSNISRGKANALLLILAMTLTAGFYLGFFCLGPKYL